ncbi:MAG: putative membrane protein YfcA [Planctomycetota bacterium]|jgi:uncharacterized membrane protein YfcA
MSIALFLICLGVGALIGAIGIGGVLLVPSLNYLAGISVHEAIPACMLSYLATGTVGALIYARHGSIEWRMVGWLCIGAIPAAFLGATSLTFIPAIVVKLIIAAVMILAGIDALLKLAKPKASQKSITNVGLIGIGLVTGFGSAITGTGGPLVLVPLSIFFGLPVLTAVGLSQAVQIPIAIFASIANWNQGNLNVTLGLIIAASMVVGTLVGATLIHRLPVAPLKKLVATLLVVVGAGIGMQIIANL